MGRLRYHPFAAERDLDVHLLAPLKWRQFGRTLEADPAADPGITLHLEPIVLSNLPGLKWYGHFYPGLDRLLRQIRPDVVHLWEEPWSAVALQAAMLKNNAALVLEVDQNILKRLPPPFETIRRAVLRRTDLILSRSPDATAVVRACGFEGVTRPIGYGVNQAVFFPGEAKESSYGRDRPLRLAYVGRLIEEKGIDDALMAMTLARSDIRLSIMGEGPHEMQLRSRVRALGLDSKVTFRSWGSPDEVASFIRAADATILLTRTTRAVREQFGRAITESQSSGVPVIGSACGAIPDVVADGGWIIPESDPAALAKLLEHLHGAPDEIMARGAAGRSNVAKRFTHETVARALGEAWREAESLKHHPSLARSESVLQKMQRNVSTVLSNGRAPQTDQGAVFRIVQTVQEFSTEGGVETVAFELAQAWSRSRVPNSVLTSAVAGNARTGTQVRRVAPWLAKIPTRGALRHLGRMLVVPVFTLAASLSLRKHRDAVIVSHGDSLVGDVLVVHAVNAVSLNEKNRSGKWTWRLNPLHLWVGLRDRFMIGGRRYRRYVAVSPRVASELETYYNVPRELISVIPNGIALDKFRPNPSLRHVIRNEFGVPARAPLLLFAGHEFDRKGLAYAIEALKQLDDDVCLLVAGSDNPAPYRRLLANGDGRLFFAGARTDMPAFYAAADAFVLPTAYETFSLVCMEALASGVPVFATRVGGIEDYLEDGRNGYGIERDGADIAAKLRPVLGDNDRLSALREGARATAERFDWNAVAARYAVLLQEVWAAKTCVRTISSAAASHRTILAG
jgi:glycosyltransferase involved in cell wall biosynthesis